MRSAPTVLAIVEDGVGDKDFEERVEQLLKVADEAGPGDARLVESVIDELRVTFGRDPPPEGLYALAYAWYMHPERTRSPVIQGRVEEFLLGVVQCLPRDYLSWLYLGHNRYDVGDFCAAHRFLEEAIRFASKDYIGLKSYEMLVCCELRLRDIREALDSLERFVKVAQECEKVDVAPVELAKTLKQLAADAFDPSQRQRLVALAAALDEAGQLNDSRWISDIVGAIFGAPRFEYVSSVSETCSSGLVVSIHDVSSRQDLFDAFARALMFPDHFGKNWDALVDCLSDLSWIKTDEVTIVHDGLPLQLPAGELKSYLECLRHVLERKECGYSPKLRIAFLKRDALEIARLLRTQ
jgi:RNAse (barnase) inhibitor barstar